MIFWMNENSAILNSSAFHLPSVNLPDKSLSFFQGDGLLDTAKRRRQSHSRESTNFINSEQRIPPL